MSEKQFDEYRLSESASMWRIRAGALAFVLLIAFVGIIPTMMDVRRMPAVHSGDETRGIHLSAWREWPGSIELLGVRKPGHDLANTYAQLAHFANRSVRPMADLQTTIDHVREHRASRNDLLEAARAASAAAADERDALMGLVVPPSLRSNSLLNKGWEEAQLAALAKLTAFDKIQAATTAPNPLQAKEFRGYLDALKLVRSETDLSMAYLRRSAA